MTDIESYRNRLRKNAKHWGKWARRQGISCYRLYDRDIPEFALAVDRYEDQIHLQEYERRSQSSDAEQQAWWEAVIDATAEVLELPRDSIHGKTRRRQQGESQYEATGESGREYIVEEQGRRFRVNLDAYVDTGLFLDHRNTRHMVAERAQGKRFLNLFAYTGSFTVYAATAGARDSVTVDMSNTYQDWSRRNFKLNGLDLQRHQLVRADVFMWIREALEQGEEFDLIVLDPPTFSQSKKMHGVLDIQRDHPWLIHQCMKLLTPQGVLFFSTNFRKFKLEPSLHDWYVLEEISSQTVPEDFRDKKIHRCWHVVHK
ncbi:MAG: class I SAM-dependent methyltransferase [Gammaproteobacteria bacterium]|nr:class I SAM-dependent methyltransferase [Gammaproteobacteria bacterium]